MSKIIFINIVIILQVFCGTVAWGKSSKTPIDIDNNGGVRINNLYRTYQVYTLEPYAGTKEMGKWDYCGLTTINRTYGTTAGCEVTNNLTVDNDKPHTSKSKPTWKITISMVGQRKMTCKATCMNIGG